MQLGALIFPYWMHEEVGVVVNAVAATATATTAATLRPHDMGTGPACKMSRPDDPWMSKVEYLV